jgi:hypothetical protein
VPQVSSGDLGPSIESLKQAPEQLSGAAVPLGRLMERLPGGGRRRGDSD